MDKKKNWENKWTKGTCKDQCILHNESLPADTPKEQSTGTALFDQGKLCFAVEQVFYDEANTLSECYMFNRNDFMEEDTTDPADPDNLKKFCFVL